MMFTQTLNKQVAVLSGHGKPSKRMSMVPRHLVRMSKLDEPTETSSGNDSYSKIEAPVRDTIPEGGKPVNQRNWGQEQLNPALKEDQDFKPLGSDISAADAMRFAGAIPEVANSRLAMLGVFAALIAEAKTGRNVFEQFSAAPLPIIGVFFLFTLATAVPVFRSTPRKGNGIFSSDAELVNGRVAMVGFLGIVISTFYTGHSIFFL
jgi:hypothetical protein